MPGHRPPARRPGAWPSRFSGRESGAYRYLGGYLDGSGGLPRLAPTQVGEDADAAENLLANTESPIAVYAQHVPHGIVPALGFRNVRRVAASYDGNIRLAEDLGCYPIS